MTRVPAGLAPRRDGSPPALHTHAARARTPATARKQRVVRACASGRCPRPAQRTRHGSLVARRAPLRGAGAVAAPPRPSGLRAALARGAARRSKGPRRTRRVEKKKVHRKMARVNAPGPVKTAISSSRANAGRERIRVAEAQNGAQRALRALRARAPRALRARVGGVPGRAPRAAVAPGAPARSRAAARRVFGTPPKTAEYPNSSVRRAIPSSVGSVPTFFRGR